MLQNETTVNEQHSILIRWSSDLNWSQSLYLYEQQLSGIMKLHLIKLFYDSDKFLIVFDYIIIWMYLKQNLLLNVLTKFNSWISGP